MSERAVHKGIAVCPGVAIGPIWVIDGGLTNPPRLRVGEARIEGEVERVFDAMESARSKLEEAKASLHETHGEIYGQLLDAQLLMYGDAMLRSGVESKIRDLRMAGEWAVRATIDELKAPLLSADSRYFRERAEDIELVGRQILRELGGGAIRLPPKDAEVIVVASVLSPADAAELRDSSVLGIATESGSATSHTAILARALGLPAVVAAHGIAHRAEAKRIAIVDAIRGEVVIEPDEAEREDAERRAERYRQYSLGLKARRDAPVVTLDGHPVEIYANVELSFEVDRVVKQRAHGVGLFRTEFLYLNRLKPPTEEEQLEVYRRTIERLEGRPITFRTFDLGADKMPRFERGIPKPSVSFGRTGLRYALSARRLFRTQLRALLRAATHGPMSVMFPAVAGVDDLRAALTELASVREELRHEGLPFGEPPIGCMIELPSAALRSHRLAEHADFFSVGTNDLVQHTLAVDRNDPFATGYASPLEPAVLDLLQMSVASASARGIPISICGDMASDPVALPLVLGLGFSQLSAPIAMLPMVQETVRRVALEDCKALARDAMAAASASAVRALVREAFGEALGELWAQHGAFD